MQQYGVRGLYAGLKPSLVGDMIGTGLGFFAYEKANGIFEHMTGRRPQTIEKGFVGAASAMVVMTGTMPLELIQRRMQVRSQDISRPACRLLHDPACPPELGVWSHVTRPDCHSRGNSISPIERACGLSEMPRTKTDIMPRELVLFACNSS